MGEQRMADQVAVITGGSRGIGRAAAIALADEVAMGVVNYASSCGAADEVVKLIGDAGGEAIAVQGDMANQDDVANLLKTTMDTWGRVDVWVNNA
ncbi:MAG: SDR family NAD(P)-dependent oxidoreductase, partial [Cyanophyceae cyanobacterium]